MAEITTLTPKTPVSPFYYRVIELVDLNNVSSYLPQRGILTEDEKEMWFDGVPQASPTLELAKEWLRSMISFDAKNTPGKVVYVEGISP